MNFKIFGFPLSYSKFKRKRDAAYDGDPNGDYVMAEDVNELQESIERIERVLDLEKLTQTVVGELNDKVSKNAIMDFGSPLFIRYGGSSISAYESIEERINGFSYIPYVMLNKETSSNFDYFLERLKASGSKVFGIVNCQNPNLGALETEIDWFKKKGFHGILLDHFGFENGMTRPIQNSTLEYIHQQELMAIVTGEIETTLFNKLHSNNPLQEDLQVTSTDFYLAQNIFIENGEKKDPAVVSDSIFQLNKAQAEKKIKVMVEDTTDQLQDSIRLFVHGKMMATLFNLDGYCLVPNSRYTLNEQVERFIQGFEIGAWKVNDPVYVEETNQTSRVIAKGRIVFDKDNNTCYVSGVELSPEIYTWQVKSIPGEAVDLGSAEYDEIVIDAIVDAINQNDSMIHFSKIDGLNEVGITPESIREVVIRAINNSPAAIKKNPPDGYDSIAGNDYIHGGVIHHIDASSITSGDLEVDRIKTNVIEAVNAYIGTAVIDSAKIGELKADHIQAVVVDAINLYAENIIGDKALINSAVIGDLSADHIKGVVVEAVNLYAGNAVIDAAKIGQLSAEHIQAEVIQAINASIENAVIDSAKIGKLEAHHISGEVIEAINLSASEARIDVAKISDLTAEHLTAGIIEALQISASKGEFDSLKAAVIDVVNATVKQAFIDGAIIQDGTIGSVQIGEGSITDAHIVNLTANKINSGVINTGQVNLMGDNAHLRIVGNKIQVFDAQPTPIERVAIGDVDNDGSVFGLRVRGADGKTVLYDENGVYNEGITDGAIDNPKIADGAVENRHVVVNTLTGDKLVMETITAREIAASAIKTNHLSANAIVAGSGIIAEGAIGKAEIGHAVITTAHIDELDASVIKTGVLEAGRVQIGAGTSFEPGFSPDELREEMENRIPFRVEIISTNGIIFKSGQVSTTLIAKVYKGPTEITDEIPAARFNWIRVGANGEEDAIWAEQHKGMKQVEIDQDDVFQRATFLCEILES